MKGVTHPDAKSCVVLGEYLRHVIISDKFSLVELSEYSFSEGILGSFKVYFREACEDAIFPVSVSKETVKVRVIV
jgi:hypothetical protein